MSSGGGVAERKPSDASIRRDEAPAPETRDDEPQETVARELDVRRLVEDHTFGILGPRSRRRHRTSAPGPWDRVRRVTLPLLTPALFCRS